MPRIPCLPCLLFVAFTGCVAIVAGRPQLAATAAIPVAVIGFAALFAIDRVYDKVRPPGSLPLHSADTVLTGLFLILRAFAVPIPVGLRLLHEMTNIPMCH